MKNKKAKRIVTVLLLVIIFTGSIESNAYTYIDEMILSVCNDVRMEWEIGKTEDFLENGEEIIDDTESKRKDAEEEEIQPYADVAADFLSEFSFKQKLIEINGTVAKSLNLRELYKNNGGVVLNNGYVVGIYPYTSTDYEVRQMVKLKTYLETDHHWTTLAGKMAAENIAKELNNRFSYTIDLSLYDADKFVYKEYHDAWLGE